MRPTLLALTSLSLLLGACAGGCGATASTTTGDASGEVDRAAARPAARPAERPLPADRAKVRDEYKAMALQNGCPEGYPRLQGRWKFIGDTRTPEFSDVLDIRGTRYTEQLSGRPEGEVVTAAIEGEVRCLFKNRVLMMVDKVRPEGAFDNQSGDLYPCDVLDDMEGAGAKMLLICYFDWDLRPSAGLEFEYERVAE